MNSLDPDWINTNFKDLLSTWGQLNKYNNPKIPVLGNFTYNIFKNLLSIAIDIQNICRISTYNPLYQNFSLYFTNNKLYHNGDLITVQNLIQYQQAIFNLSDSLNYLLNNNYTNPLVNKLQSQIQPLFQILELLTRHFDGNNIYGQIHTDISKTSIRIGYNGILVFTS